MFKAIPKHAMANDCTPRVECALCLPIQQSTLGIAIFCFDSRSIVDG